MGEVKTIVTDIDRQENLRVLRNLIGHDDRIEDLLIILDIDLDPAPIPNRDRVLLSTPDALGADSIASSDHHHNRKPERSGPDIRLEHEGQTLTRSSCEDPSSGKRGTLEDTQGRMLALHFHKVRI
jgi:hypothetical protein